MARRGLRAILLLLASLALTATPAAEQELRVSLLLGDAAGRQAADAVAWLKNTHPELARTRIEIYSSTRYREQDLDHLMRSNLVVLHSVGRALLTGLRAELGTVIASGGRVVVFGPSFTGDDAAMGLVEDQELGRYFGSGGMQNMRNGLLHALAALGLEIDHGPPQDVPVVGLYERGSGAWFTDFESFKASYGNHDPARPWVGFVVYQSNVVAGATAHLDAVIDALERRGFNVLTVFGYPPERPIEQYFFSEDGAARVEAVVAASMKIGMMPEVVTPVLQRLDVPVINAISLLSASRAEWETSPIGMDVMERSWQLAMPEMGGLTQPTVFAAKDVVVHPASGAQYVEERPILERVERLADRVERWVTLRTTPNADKRIFLQYFNFPPGREGIGASYLNVVPESLWSVLQRMRDEGFDLAGLPESPEQLTEEVIRYGSNIPAWNHDEVSELVRSGRAVLLPVETYREWLGELPRSARDALMRQWGDPDMSSIMSHRGRDGRRRFVFPVLRYGNVLLGPQPSRGWTENPDALYHDVSVAPPHHYVAFYLWLQREFGADAMFQFGTHGTHEWLPGKEAGLSIDDPPEYLVGDLPNLYAFIMDNPGEATQAMRRGMATMISHLTPPFDQAELNPELRELEARIADYQRALGQSPLLAEAQLEGVIELAGSMGLLNDLGLSPAADELVEELHHFLEELSGRPTPFGMHTFGVPPREQYLRSTAEAIVGREELADEAARAARIGEIEARILGGARQELDALVAGLSGRYIPAGVGGDPLRNPEALPSGRNFYSFDPRRIPAAPTYRLGQRLAAELIENYRSEHGSYPEKLTYTLWGVETMRHEGVQESQIMYLMGIRPMWDERGIVRGVEAIPREELGRPRIDVTVIPSGLHRDLFSNVLALLDEAVTLAQAQDEPDNHVRNQMLETRARLEGAGVESSLAARMAAVRLFSVPPGAYGTNIENLVDRSDTWTDEQQIADVYFMRMSHMYGQGFWGDGGDGGGHAGIGRDLLKTALSGTRMTVHARSSNVYQVLDGDDPFASFGGVTLAVRAVDGATPSVVISNLADPAAARQESLERFMSRELHSRYLNPQWISAMQQEGYAGAKFINQVVQNLWGWQVTVPEAVSDGRWEDFYQVYVEDRYELGIEQFFRDSGNLWAYQAMAARMLEAVRKDYWDADVEVVKRLGELVSELIGELQLACDEEHCHDPVLTMLVQAELVPVPVAPAGGALAEGIDSGGAPGSQAQGAAPQPVRGFQMEEIRVAGAEPGKLEQGRILALLAMFIALCWGFLNPYPQAGWRT